MLPLIFKTESILKQLLSFSPSSQHSCFTLLPNAGESMPDGNAQRPLQSHRGHSGEGRGRNSCTQASPAPQAPRSCSASCRCRPAPRSAARPSPPPLGSHMQPLPLLRASGVASRPSSHTLSIRCVYFFPDSRHIWSTYSGYSSATRHIPQDHFSGCYGDLPPSSDFQVA